MSDLRQRLEAYLDKRGGRHSIVELSPDASTREYFRIVWGGSTAIACVYPDSFIAGEQSFLDVTGLFRSNGLPVAEIYDYDEALGVIVQEDLGDMILRQVLADVSDAERDRLLNEAITLIARIQKATATAYDSGSVASRLKFDVEKLQWELEFFAEHYFSTLKNRPLQGDLLEDLRAEFRELCEELESRATVLCHRDFHAANLMIDSRGDLRIIDHQDARIGSVAYDLVSLLLDRITKLPTADWLAAKRRYFLEERAALGLAKLDEDAFAYEFRLQTIQRCLKAAGTFSFQSANRGKTHFIQFIDPMFRIVLRAIENLNRFPVLRNILTQELNS
ncbi:MAG: phosphotransferase [Pyrinomonadaceae bacterium]|nr:phosphotransferase [Pyrinomonadaceae bacterium]